MTGPEISKSLFTKHNLLSALIGVCTLTFGLFSWNAIRAFDKLDDVQKNVAAVSSTNAVQEQRIGALEARQDRTDGIVADHTTRIVKLEVSKP